MSRTPRPAAATVPKDAAALASMAEAEVVRGDTRLYVRRWRPAGPRGKDAAAAKGRVVVVHGYQEHGGRYREAAGRWLSLGLEVVAYDHRGHGRSTGPRGHVADFADYEQDLLAVLTATATAGAPLPTFLFGHSMGGLVVLHAAISQVFAGQTALNLRGLLVTNPYLGLALPVPWPKRLLGHLLGRALPRFSLPANIDPTLLTRDAEILDSYRRDSLLINRASAGWFRATQRAQRALALRAHLDLPLYFAYSDTDPVANPRVNAAFAARVTSPDKTVLLRPGELHELLHEQDRLALADAMGVWMQRRL